MAGKREDRRVRITKRAIRESLVELMQRYPISKISVKMICEGADINRSTFYAHYTDQYDLLRQVQQEVFDGFTDQILGSPLTTQSELTVPILVQILKYARDNAALFKALLGESEDNSFQTALMGIAQEKSLQEIQEDKRLEPRIAAYLETFAISGYVSIIRKWLEEGCVDEPEPLAELMTKLLFGGIMSPFAE